ECFLRSSFVGTSVRRKGGNKFYCHYFLQNYLARSFRNVCLLAREKHCPPLQATDLRFQSGVIRLLHCKSLRHLGIVQGVDLTM
ncbi:hypothetical protein M514_00708, partial [Trichuris suis]